MDYVLFASESRQGGRNLWAKPVPKVTKKSPVRGLKKGKDDGEKTTEI
ncbi:hypothetical protein [Thalassomonas actiniarum]|uniref:Uncharacterized protein n=1 Tax=Thalassomonas actiniarum TaxID=485447 RepID=A0AAF0C2Q0_9GAMM|nr:hypothetical protein [Thalassomonas actiniarum]WDD98080.1 hypothetical protein SG35_022780 [Thalassomonas actiniarum]